QLAGVITPARRNRGSSRRSGPCNSLYESRPASQTHDLFTSGLRRGTNRYTTPSFESTRMLQPVEQCAHTDSTLFKNHTRWRKRKSLEVSAPTGQMSTMLPM